jgi:hypothetical protein
MTKGKNIKISIKAKIRLRIPENNPRYNDGRTLKSIFVKIVVHPLFIKLLFIVVVDAKFVNIKNILLI